MNSFCLKSWKNIIWKVTVLFASILAFEGNQTTNTYVIHEHIFLFFKALYNWIFLENELYLHIYFYIYISSAKWTAKSSIFKDDLMRKLFETIKLNQMTYSSPTSQKWHSGLLFWVWKIMEFIYCIGL